MRRLRAEQSGYSMVEVLAAIIILSLAILPMVSMFDAGLRSAVLGGNYDKARATANSNLEELKTRSLSEIPENDSPCPSDPPEGLDTCKVERTPLDSELEELDDPDDEPSGYELEVTVGWDGNSYTANGVVMRGSL